jgi:hypothetical protein
LEARVRELKINPEFENLIDPLEGEERNELMLDLKAHGCIYPIVTWNDTIVDGHNRYRICTENGILFQTISMQFEDAEDAKIWILTQQIARRNLDEFRKYELIQERDKLKKLKMKAKEKQLSGLNRNPSDKMAANQNTTESSAVVVSNLDTTRPKSDDISDEKDNVPLSTRKEIAKELGVGMGTVARMHYIKKKADEDSVADEVLKQLRTGKVSVNKVYSDIKKKEMGVQEDEGKNDASAKSTKSLDGNALRSALRKAVEALKDVSWADITNMKPEELRQSVVNEMQILNVRTNDILKGMRGD